MITVERATEEDIREFAANIRDMDAKEVEVMSGIPFKDQVEDLIKYRKDTKVVKYNGVILCIGGWYHEMLDWGLYSEGVVGWMLLTNAVEDHKIEFLRWSKELVKTLLEAYPAITNVVDSRNLLHVQYLDFLGAKFWEDQFRKDLWHFIIERS